jgi:hypothetical protein
VDVSRATEKLKGIPMVTFNAQVPLRKRAVQLSVFGPLEKEAELRMEMKQILGTIEGPSNWLDRQERVSRGYRALAKLAGISLIILLLIRRAQKKAAEGRF